MPTPRTKHLKISPETHRALQRLGTKGETFDALILRLCDKNPKRKKGTV